jgi:hypothetical protein
MASALDARALQITGAAVMIANIARNHRGGDGLPLIVTIAAHGGGESAVMLTNPRHAGQHLTAQSPALLAAVTYAMAEPGRRIRLAP